MSDRFPKGPAISGSAAATRRLVWLALALSPVIYGVVLKLVLPSVTLEEVPEVPVWIFGAAALGAVWASTILRRGIDSDAEGRNGAVVHPRLLISWALDESVAVVGLVAGILGGNFNVYIPFAVIALGLLWLHRPRS